MRRSEVILLIGAVAGAVLALYADTCHTKPAILEQMPVTQESLLSVSTRPLPTNPIGATELVERWILVSNLAPEEWHGTDRKLTEYEWELLSQMLMAEARGESFDVQYCIACVVLNRVDSPLFPDTVAGVIYQTQPTVQFYGAWDTEWYEPTDSTLEAIQTALEENRTPSNLFYFTSEGWLPETEPWKQIASCII